MASVEKLIIIQGNVSEAKTEKKAESLGRIDHIAFLSVKNATGFSADIILEHSPNSSRENEGDWITLHDFGTVTVDGIALQEITAKVMPSVRARITSVSGDADIEVSLLADRRGK